MVTTMFNDRFIHALHRLDQAVGLTEDKLTALQERSARKLGETQALLADMEDRHGRLREEVSEVVAEFDRLIGQAGEVNGG